MHAFVTLERRVARIAPNEANPRHTSPQEAKEGNAGTSYAEAMLALSNAVTVRRLSDAGKPAHLRESERQSLVSALSALI